MLESKNKRTVVCDSHPDALDRLKEQMSAVAFDPNDYYIILTPDRYTLGVEQKLFRGGGSINCEVLTLSRLCRRVLPKGKALSREGSVMLVSRAIKNVKDKLVFYKNAVRYYDFARSVLETLLQIGASGLTPSDIEATGATAGKLSDLALIAEEYDRLKSGCSDATDRLRELIAAASASELVKKSHIIAIGYSDPTKLNRDVFDALARSCKSFTLYEATRQTRVSRRDKVDVFVASDRITQYKKIAADIRNYAIDGGRYGDVSVICPEPRALVRILGEYGIRFYAETSVPLAETSPTAALRALYGLREPNADDLIALCKNPYSGCDRADAEKLQNYLSERGIARGVLNIGIDDERARRARDTAKKLAELFHGEKTETDEKEPRAAKFAESVRAVIGKADFECVQARIGMSDNATDVLQPIDELLALLDSYGTGAFDGDAEAFFSAARSAEVKSLPRYGDCVTVCQPSSLRMTRCKRLYVVDFNDGVLPCVTLDTGLIGDAEIHAVRDRIEPTAREKNRRDAAELAAVINNAENVYCSYCTAEGGRSALLAAADTAEHRSEDADALLKRSDDPSEIAYYACAESAARELAARKATKYSASLDSAAGDIKKASGFVNNVGSVTLRSLSASELSAWFSCPYKRFLKYTVGVGERKRDKVAALDFGIIMHSFMESLVNEYERDGDMDCSETHVRELVNAALEKSEIELTDDDALLYERMLSDARRFALDNKTVIERGKFVPKFAEREFEGDIALGAAQVPFKGKIDRIDVCGDKARIIDYKTNSGKRFDVKSCIDGTDMQLPLYAAAVPDYDVVGFFYMPMRPEYNAKGELLSGAFVKDVELAKAFDSGIECGEQPPVIKARLTANGAAFKNPSATVMDYSDFERLKYTCVAAAGVAADEIACGYIERSPADGACVYCPYGALCSDKRSR